MCYLIVVWDLYFQTVMKVANSKEQTHLTTEVQEYLALERTMDWEMCPKL
jgi:hypothetical protein